MKWASVSLTSLLAGVVYSHDVTHDCENGLTFTGTDWFVGLRLDRSSVPWNQNDHYHYKSIEQKSACIIGNLTETVERKEIDGRLGHEHVVVVADGPNKPLSVAFDITRKNIKEVVDFTDKIVFQHFDGKEALNYEKLIVTDGDGLVIPSHMKTKCVDENFCKLFLEVEKAAKYPITIDPFSADQFPVGTVVAEDGLYLEGVVDSDERLGSSVGFIDMFDRVDVVSGAPRFTNTRAAIDLTPSFTNNELEPSDENSGKLYFYMNKGDGTVNNTAMYSSSKSIDECHSAGFGSSFDAFSGVVFAASQSCPIGQKFISDGDDSIIGTYTVGGWSADSTIDTNDVELRYFAEYIRESDLDGTFQVCLQRDGKFALCGATIGGRSDGNRKLGAQIVRINDRMIISDPEASFSSGSDERYGVLYAVNINNNAIALSFSDLSFYRFGTQFDGQFGKVIATGNIKEIRDRSLTDLFVAEPGYSTETLSAAGRVHIYIAASDRKSFYVTRSRDNYQILSGKYENGGFGSAITALGEVTGDIYGDIAIGAPYALNGRGVVEIWKGADFFSLPAQLYQTIYGEKESDLFGFSLYGRGFDFNGDSDSGLADLLVGAPGYDSSLAPAEKESKKDGKVYILVQKKLADLTLSLTADSSVNFEEDFTIEVKCSNNGPETTGIFSVYVYLGDVSVYSEDVNANNIKFSSADGVTCTVPEDSGATDAQFKNYYRTQCTFPDIPVSTTLKVDITYSLAKNAYPTSLEVGAFHEIQPPILNRAFTTSRIALQSYVLIDVVPQKHLGRGFIYQTGESLNADGSPICASSGPCTYAQTPASGGVAIRYIPPAIGNNVNNLSTETIGTATQVYLRIQHPTDFTYLKAVDSSGNTPDPIPSCSPVAPGLLGCFVSQPIPNLAVVAPFDGLLFEFSTLGRFYSASSIKFISTAVVGSSNNNLVETAIEEITNSLDITSVQQTLLLTVNSITDPSYTTTACLPGDKFVAGDRRTSAIEFQLKHDTTALSQLSQASALTVTFTLKTVGASVTNERSYFSKVRSGSSTRFKQVCNPANDEMTVIVCNVPQTYLRSDEEGYITIGIDTEDDLDTSITYDVTVATTSDVSALPAINDGIIETCAVSELSINYNYVKNSTLIRHPDGSGVYYPLDTPNNGIKRILQVTNAGPSKLCTVTDVNLFYAKYHVCPGGAETCTEAKEIANAGDCLDVGKSKTLVLDKLYDLSAAGVNTQAVSSTASALLSADDKISSVDFFLGVDLSLLVQRLAPDFTIGNSYNMSLSISNAHTYTDATNVIITWSFPVELEVENVFLPNAGDTYVATKGDVSTVVVITLLKVAHSNIGAPSIQFISAQVVNAVADTTPLLNSIATITSVDQNDISNLYRSKSGSFNFRILARPDLVTQMFFDSFGSGTQPSFPPGNTFVVTGSIVNIGTLPAENITVTFSFDPSILSLLPQQAALNNSCFPDGYDAAAGTFYCNFPNGISNDKDEVEALTLTFAVASDAPIGDSSALSVLAQTQNITDDQNLNNNKVTRILTIVEPSVDLLLDGGGTISRIVDNPAPIKMTMKIANYGISTARGVRLYLLNEFPSNELLNRTYYINGVETTYGKPNASDYPSDGLSVEVLKSPEVIEIPTIVHTLSGETTEGIIVTIECFPNPEIVQSRKKILLQVSDIYVKETSPDFTHINTVDYDFILIEPQAVVLIDDKTIPWWIWIIVAMGVYVIINLAIMGGYAGFFNRNRPALSFFYFLILFFFSFCPSLSPDFFLFWWKRNQFIVDLYNKIPRG